MQYVKKRGMAKIASKAWQRAWSDIFALSFLVTFFD
jgi:hypothetical protein